MMVDKVSNMYITGPDVIKAVTGEEISHEDLGEREPILSRVGMPILDSGPRKSVLPLQEDC